MYQRIVCGENLEYIRKMQSDTFDLIIIDPPYNTGNVQSIHDNSYTDNNENYIQWLGLRLEAAKRILKQTGSIFVFCDWRESAYIKVEMDKIFGRKNFRNEIIWSYDYGGRSKRVWSRKHDTIYWYSKTEDYTFNFDAIDRIPYMAPSLVGAEKTERGKTPTDVWWNTIVPTNGKERVGYPTQKPLSIIERIILVHSNKDDYVLDFFCGSGTTGVACKKHNRHFYLIDSNPEAIRITHERLATVAVH